MIKLNPEKFQNLMAEKGYQVFENKLNIVGYRNRFGRPNSFDDTISIYLNNQIHWEEYHFAATTMPGTPHLLKPVSVYGTAILVPGQYLDSYKIGLHRGSYKALVQAKSVRVYRDNNKDTVYDKDERKVQVGMFGINIHKASLKAQVVGANSAGCQVIQKAADYEQFLKICLDVPQLTFSYTLVEL